MYFGTSFFRRFGAGNEQAIERESMDYDVVIVGVHFYLAAMIVGWMRRISNSDSSQDRGSKTKQGPLCLYLGKGRNGRFSYSQWMSTQPIIP